MIDSSDDHREPREMKKVLVLVSGTGSNLQYLLDSSDSKNSNIDFDFVAVGSDTKNAQALNRAQKARIENFVVETKNYETRQQWESALHKKCASYRPDLVVLAGFMKILSPEFVRSFTIINTHPSLLPSFQGKDAVKQALDYGVKITGCSAHYVDEGVDTGKIITQTAVNVFDDDTVETLQERIKSVEGENLRAALNLVLELPSHR